MDIISRLPLPVAQIYLRAWNAKGIVERHNHAYYLLEATIKQSASVAIQAYLSLSQRTPSVDEQIRTLGMPSAGHWVQALRSLCLFFATSLEDDSYPLAAWARAITEETSNLPHCLAFCKKVSNEDGLPLRSSERISPLDLFNLMPAYRNIHLGHGAVSLESYYAEVTPLLLHAAQELLTYLDLVPAAGEVLFVEEVRSLGNGNVQVERLSLMGGQALRCEPLLLSGEEAKFWSPGKLYAVWPNIGHPLCLSPLLHGTWYDEHSEVYFLNRALQNELPEYLSYTSGKVLKGRGFEGDFKTFLARINASVGYDGNVHPEISPQTSSSTPPKKDKSPLSQIALPKQLGHLEHSAEAIALECGHSILDIDNLLDAIVRFHWDALHFLNSLHEAATLNELDPSIQAYSLSLAHLSRSVERTIRAGTAGPGQAGPLDGALLKLQKAVFTNAIRLYRDLERRSLSYNADESFFDASPSRSKAPEIRHDDQEWMDNLLSADSLRHHEAILELSSDRMGTLLDFLHRLPDRSRQNVLDRIWNSIDVLLIEARGRSRPIFEAAMEDPSDTYSRDRWTYLFYLFQKTGDSYWDPLMVTVTIEQKYSQDSRVFGRCLLFHPWEEYRSIARRFLAPEDYWEVISDGRTSVRSLLEIWRHLKPQVTSDFQKVFLACAKDTLSKRGEADRALAAVELLKEFFEVDSFHENVYFKLLDNLEEIVRKEALRHHLLVNLDEEYIARFKKFFQQRPSAEIPVCSWAKIPLPIQRRLANRGHFLKYFVCHPVDPIAMECLRHLVTQESIIDYVSMPSINGRLLVELAKESRLFRWDEARYALVANPKTPSYVVVKHISYLRGDSLKKLSKSYEANQFSRQFAVKLLDRKV